MFKPYINKNMEFAAVKSAVLLACFVFLLGCEKKAPTEEYSYNAFFVTPEPDSKRVYVGTVTGLSSCKYIVSDYFNKRRKFIKGNWDYVCCWRDEEHQCIEEHRYNE
jgi:hypothetical protein